MEFYKKDFLRLTTLGVASVLLDPLSLYYPELYAATVSHYVVKKGDSLTSIAKRFGCSISSLRSVNSISGDLIFVGQKLVIPSRYSVSSSKSSKPKNVNHTVKKGEYLSKIATQYGSTVSAIRDANKLEKDTIYVGQNLKVPVGVEVKSEKKELVFVSKAKGTVHVKNLNKKRWKYVVGHHSGTPVGNGQIFDWYHRKRGMENGLAYHFVIGNGSESGDGEIEVSERWKRQIHGGHVKSNWYNEHAIGICMVGDFEKKKPTRKQVASFIELIHYLRTDLVHKKLRLLLHREIRNEKTICPGKFFPAKAMHKLFG
ncbi:MAG: LysM peptidoglycan-binding domain-containing protein [Verrucomicrobiota bacterium]